MIKKFSFYNGIAIFSLLFQTPGIALADLTSSQMDSLFECTSLFASAGIQSVNYEKEFAGNDPDINARAAAIFDDWEAFVVSLPDPSKEQENAVNKHTEYLFESMPAFEEGYLVVNRDRASYRNRLIATLDEFDKCVGKN